MGSDNNAAANGADALRDALRALWDRFQPVIEQRIAVLEQAASAAQARCLSTDLCEQAEKDAHKLAGSLGSLGVAKGSEVAREAERILQGGVQAARADATRLAELAAALRSEFHRGPD
jgi:HPt (histidine-containing phosphotransfer) domain-containing protein